MNTHTAHSTARDPIDWQAVDWNRSNADLAREHGVTRQAVYKARKKAFRPDTLRKRKRDPISGQGRVTLDLGPLKPRAAKVAKTRGQTLVRFVRDTLEERLERLP